MLQSLQKRQHIEKRTMYTAFKDESKRAGIAYILNVILFIFGVAGLIITLKNMEIGEMFSYYTQDSNIFSMLVSGVYLFYIKKEIPGWLRKLRFAATVSLMLTFTVVILVLGPMYGVESYPWLFFHGANFFYHVSCPILSFISCILFEKNGRIIMKDTVIAIIPTLIYALILIILNVLNVVHGPYPFLYVHEQPVFMSIIWGIVIPGIAWMIALLIKALRNKMVAK